MKRHLAGLAGGRPWHWPSPVAARAGRSDSGGSDGKTIRFVAAKYDDDTQAYWTALIKDFEKANPGYRVNLEVVDWEQMDSKVKTYVQTKQEPDILNYNKFSDFARDGLVYKARTSCRPRSGRHPPAVRRGQYTGPRTACPSSPGPAPCSTTRTCSRRRHSRAAATWDELEADAKKIKKAGVQRPRPPLGPEEAQAEF